MPAPRIPFGSSNHLGRSARAIFATALVLGDETCGAVAE
jgi:hypothetical protein